jgi:ABC-2 type transport system permease protein
LKEKEAGSFRRLLAAPIHRASLIAGKMGAYIVVVCLQMLVMFGVGNLLFDMPLGRAPLGLVLLTLAVALASTGLGMLVGALARTSKQAGTIGLVLGFVLLGAAGFTPGADIVSRPTEGFQFYLAQVTPHHHAFEGYLKLLVDELGVVDILPNVVVLIGFAVVFFLVAMSRFKFE